MSGSVWTRKKDHDSAAHVTATAGDHKAFEVHTASDVFCSYLKTAITTWKMSTQTEEQDMVIIKLT